MKIIHLFDDLMNLYGDYGNVCGLRRALQQKGESVQAVSMSIDDEFDFSGADFIYIGSGTELNQKVALSYLMQYKDSLKAALDGGVPVLATGNSFEMFGKSITDCDGKTYDGLGFFDFTVTEGNERIVTDARCECELCSDPLIGFINKASCIKGVATPLFHLSEGSGNDNTAPEEGIVSGSFYGTHLIGPVLIRNPQLCEYFAGVALNSKR